MEMWQASVQEVERLEQDLQVQFLKIVHSVLSDVRISSSCETAHNL